MWWKLRKADNNYSDTVIGQGTVIQGVLDIKCGIEVHGTLTSGRVVIKKALVVGKEGDVKADAIEVEEATISGKVVGPLKAWRQVYLSAGAVFVGRLETPRLVVEEGAVLKEGDTSEQPEVDGAE
jgi:cytoskeletal protein CcmA (bactofilin family)